MSFLFTSCGVTCPEVSKHMAEIQQRITNQPDVRLVSLAVDPRSDTPPVLAKWGARYGADTNYWLLLTGDKPVMQRLIGTSFLATNNDDPFNSMPAISPAPNALLWWTNMAASAFTSTECEPNPPPPSWPKSSNCGRKIKLPMAGPFLVFRVFRGS